MGHSRVASDENSIEENADDPREEKCLAEASRRK
jgi:hypothetical protein